MVKLLLLRFRLTNSRLKNKKIHFQSLTRWVHSLTRLQKKFNSCEAKEECPHAGLYNCNGRQIELFHMKWFSYG